MTKPRLSIAYLVTIGATVVSITVAQAGSLDHIKESQLILEPRLTLQSSAYLAADEFDSNPADFGEERRIEGQKQFSPIKAAAMSILIPGAGQWYTEHRTQARIFVGAEAGIWLTYAAFKTYAGWKEDDFVRYAQRHAGVTPAGKDEEFYRLLGFYESRELFNTIGRAFEPGAPYIPDSPEWDWSWDSPEAQQQFRSLRNDWTSANRNADFMFVAAAANRLTSAVFAWFQAKSANNRLGSASEFGDTIDSHDTDTGMKASVHFSSPIYDEPAAGGLLCNVTLKF